MTSQGTTSVPTRRCLCFPQPVDPRASESRLNASAEKPFNYPARRFTPKVSLWVLAAARGVEGDVGQTGAFAGLS